MPPQKIFDILDTLRYIDFGSFMTLLLFYARTTFVTLSCHLHVCAAVGV